MLFSSFLLIAWVEVTIGTPIFPKKEIHLKIPGKDSSLRLSSMHLSKSSSDSPSPENERNNQVSDTGFLGKVTISPQPSLPGTVMTLPQPRETIFTHRYMNISSKDIKQDENSKTHLERERRELLTQQKGNGTENGTDVYDYDLSHYEPSIAEKAETAINDTTDHSLIQNWIESIPKDERNINKAEDDTETTTFVEAVQFNSKASDLRMEYKNDKNGTLLRNIDDKVLNNTNSVYELTKGETKTIQKPPLHNKKQNSFTKFNFTVTLASSESVQSVTMSTSDKRLTVDSRQGSSKDSHISSVKETDEKSNQKLNITETSLQSKRFPIKKTMFTNMQQDGVYDLVTPIITPQSKENYSTEIPLSEETRNQQNEEFLKTFSSIIIPSSSITTPDSHMNDPPFRGPNVPRDIDLFPVKKDEAKINFHKPNTIVELPSFQSLNVWEEWKQAKQVWGIAWECHCYIVGSLFAVIALYSFISLLRTQTFVTLLSTGYYTMTNTIIFLMCSMRAFYLLYDPYNLEKKYSPIVSQILLKITLPCITSSFCLLVLALLSFTKTQFLSPKFQNPSVLGVFIVFILSIFVTVEIVAGMFSVSNIFLLACYLVIISCASLSSMCYFFIFKKLHNRALRRQGEMIRVTFTKMHIDGAQLPKKLPRPTLGLAVKLVLVSAVIQIVLCFLSPYTTVFLQGLLLHTPEPLFQNLWFWWGYQLACRICELFMCATLSFVATQPLKHFEIQNNTFCSVLMWFPCSTFTECFRSEEVVDFEAHSDNYANPQGHRSTDFSSSVVNSRRLQTNSLPTFRTPITEVDTNPPMTTLPYTGRHTNHASAISLLSYYRSKRTLSLSTYEGLEDLERTLCSQTVSSDGRNSLRPASMLYKDNGFIRFRRETDPEQPMEMSDEDPHEEVDTSMEDADSTKANMGSSFHSLLEGDIVQNTLSPFFQIGYKRRFRKMSRISIETTDYSADVSSDQLSNVVNLRGGLSSSALDFHPRKYGSTCSSESAANSFDVTFFLNSNSSTEMQTSPISTTPASLNVGAAYRSETEDDKTSSVEGHEVMLRSVSPIVKRASSGRLSLNLNLHSNTDTSHSNGHVNVACGTEDITPDSAVYLDLHLSRENTISPQKSMSANLNLQSHLSPVGSFTKVTESMSPLSPETASESSVSPTSQSLDELRTSNSYIVPRARKNSRGLLCKLRGSTFSLNAAFYGYEPLEHVESKKQRKKCERFFTTQKLLSEDQLDMQLPMIPLGDFCHRAAGSGHLGDSGLLGDCGVTLVDVASQTEDADLSECPNKTCRHFGKGFKSHESQSFLSMEIERFKV